jgi:hypothetical protein
MQAQFSRASGRSVLPWTLRLLMKKSQPGISARQRRIMRSSKACAIRGIRDGPRSCCSTRRCTLLKRTNQCHDPQISFEGHWDRNDYVFDSLRTVNPWYRTLYSMSRSIRYDLFACKEEHLRFAEGEYNALWTEMHRLGFAWQD